MVEVAPRRLPWRPAGCRGPARRSGPWSPDWHERRCGPEATPRRPGHRGCATSTPGSRSEVRQCRIGVCVIGESHHVAVDPVGVGPVGLDRHGGESTFVNEPTGDAGPLPVELVRPVRGLADQDEAPVADEIEQRVVVVSSARDGVKIALQRRRDRRVNHAHKSRTVRGRGDRDERHNRGRSCSISWNLAGRKERPRQDSNLRHRLRRPVLYPLSYGGGALREQGTIVLVAQPRRPAGPPHGRAKAAVSCLSMPTDHDVATAPLERHLLPRTADRSTRRATSASAASTSSSWRRNSAHRSSSTTRTTCARPAGRPWPRGATAWPTPPRPSCAGPWPDWPTRRACTSTSRPAASSTSPCPPACPPERLVLHGNNKSTDELATALEHGVGRIVVDSFDEIARLGGLLESSPPGQDRPQGPRPGDARGRGSHPRVRAHRAGGLQVRLLRLFGRGGRGGRRARAPARRRAGRGPRAHRQPGLRRLVVRAGGRGARRVLRPARAARAGRRRRARRSLRQRRVGADPGRVGRSHPWRLRQGGRRPGHADLGRARAFHRGHRRHHALHGRARSSTSRASAPT